MFFFFSVMSAAAFRVLRCGRVCDAHDCGITLLVAILGERAMAQRFVTAQRLPTTALSLAGSLSPGAWVVFGPKSTGKTVRVLPPVSGLQACSNVADALVTDLLDNLRVTGSRRLASILAACWLALSSLCPGITRCRGYFGSRGTVYRLQLCDFTASQSCTTKQPAQVTP